MDASELVERIARLEKRVDGFEALTVVVCLTAFVIGVIIGNVF